MPRSAVFCLLRCLVSQTLFRKAIPALLAACVAAPSLAAQAIPTVSRLTVTSYTQPYSLSCSVYGTSVTGVAGPTGNVTFTDVTTGQNLGSAPLGTPAPAGFMPQVAFPLGFPNGHSLARGDFNGDGKLDLIAGGYQQVSVLLNNGDGTYQAAKLAYVSGQHVIDMAVGDFNGDNKLDVIVLDDSAVYFVAGKGDGTFQPATFIAAGPYSSVVAGDFRGNGKLDIVLSGSGVAIMPGNGDGTFQASQIFAASIYAKQVIAADFNNDQHLDLAVIGSVNGVSSVSILLGAGTGSFDAPRTYSDIPATSFSAVDDDGDGKLDLAIDLGGNDDLDTISIMKGVGDGEFQSPIVIVISKVSRYGVPAHHFGHIAAQSTWFADLTLGRIDLGGGAALAFASDTDLQVYWNTPRLVHGSDGLVAYASGDEHVVLSNPAVAANAAVSSFITVQPPATHTLHCSYPGDSNYAASTGATDITLDAATAPRIQPASGAYGAPFDATITDTTPGGGVIINYTTDGSTPTTSSPQYTGPIHITSTTTLQAIASSPNYVPSDVVTAAYTFEPIAAAPVISPPAGAYKSSSPTIQVTITGPPGATIYYSTSGIPPTTNSPQYNGPFTVSTGASPYLSAFGGAIVQAIAVVPGQVNSPLASAFYEVNRTFATASNFQCTFTGLAAFGNYPTGSVTFTDLTAGQSVGTASLAPVSKIFDPQVFSMMFGSEGFHLVAGDFNGDQKPDIVASSSGGIFGMLGNGDGTLQPPIQIAGAKNYVYGPMLTGDINEDGKLDLIVQYPYPTGFYTILGNGDGTFQTAVFHDLSSQGPLVNGIAAGDFGNGHLDLVINNGDGIYVFLGNGDGTFQNPVKVASGASAGPVAAADFNGDNKLDLAFFSSSYTAVSTMLGNGDGSFQSPQSSLLAPNFAGYSRGVLVAGDFDRDGQTDLLAAMNGVDELLGNGDGTFHEHSVVHLDNSVYSMVTGDFFHRGITDIALTQGTGQYSYPLIWVGQGDGTFYQGSGVQPKNSPTQVYGLVSGDFNGDGYSDLAFGATGSSGAALQLATGTGAVSSVAVLNPWPAPSSPPYTRNYQCSYDGDSNYQGATTQFSATFVPPPQFSLPPGHYTAGQTVTITDANTSAAIYYTTDGSTPTVQSTKYTTPVPLSGNMTLNAIASAPGTFPSAVASATYTASQPTATTTALTSSATTANIGQQITFTATVTGSSPTGTVTFKAGTTTLGNASLSNGVAALQTSFAAAGGYSVIATYSGDTNNATSTSNAVSVTVNPGTSTTSLVSSATSVNPGQQFTLTATVTGSSPTGTVTFKAGTTTLGNASLSNGVATLQTSFASAGSYSVTATYSGDTNNAASTSNTVSVTVNPATSATSLASSATTVNLGQQFTLTATVTGASPTGSVTFKAGTTTLGNASLSNGVAALQTSFANAGSYSITATYSGDANNAASTSNAVNVTVSPATSATSLASSATSVNLGQQFTLTATVTGSSPTGTVTFKSGTTTLGNASLSNGVATLQTSFANAGSYSVTATYSGDTNNAASTSNAASITVTPTTSATSLASSASSVNLGQQFTLTATVTGSSPTGSVTFTAGSTTLGQASLSNGVAALQTSFANAGSYSITATYSGDANNAASTSNAVNVTVSPATSATSLASSATSVNLGQQFTLTATVTGASPTGSVTFKAGTTTLGNASLSNGTAALQTSFASAGSYSVTATYSGDANNAASTSSAVSITVAPQSTTTALTASASSVGTNQSLTLTATVTGASPTGSVTFMAGTTTLGQANLSNGIATLQTSFATAGSYSVTATYSGDANNAASTSSAVSITVAGPGIDPGTPPGPKSVPPGGTATYPLTFSAQGGYTGTISLSCTGLPAEATCSFNPATLTLTASGSQSSTLSIVTTAPSSALAAPAGQPGEPLRAPLFFAGIAGLLFGLTRMRRFSARLRCVVGVLLLAVAATFAAGCGGGGSNSGGTGNAGTPAGTYTVTVTAQDSANNVKQTLAVTLTVQ